MNKLKDKNLYFVGGVVRDEIFGAESLDTDFCYEGNAIEFGKNNFSENLIKINEAFGTIRLKFGEKEVDIASTREETYPKAGHLPVVKNIGCSLKDDLKRRDFTINAMAKNTITGEVFDPFDGKTDIKNKQIRVLHPKSFIDDPTRIIRALKFSVRFGFELSEDTKTLQDEYLNNINYDMSYHRLKNELVETFSLNSAEAFNKFNNEGIYKLLGKNQRRINLSGNVIKKACSTHNKTENLWLVYLSFYNLETLPLTRKEKNILSWSEKLKEQKISNNTPKESIIIFNLKKETDC